MGNVVPFVRDSEYWIDKAKDNRRKGRWMDALFLQRRAVEQTGDQKDRLELAHILYEMGCFSQSVRILADLAQENDVPSECFYALSCNYLAMGEIPSSYFSLMQFLMKEPQAIGQDDVSNLLEELIYLKAQEEKGHTSRRMTYAEGLAEATAEMMALGEKSAAIALLEQALSITRGQQDEKIRWQLTLARIEKDGVQAVLLEEPDKVTWETLSYAVRVYLATKRRSKALNVIRKFEEKRPIRGSDDILLEAWQIAGVDDKVYEVARRLLQERRYDTRLLCSMAVSCVHQGWMEEAGKIWHNILHINPDDVIAEWALTCLQDGSLPRDVIYDGVLPQSVSVQWKRELTKAAVAGQPPERQLRKICHWALYGNDRQAMLLARSILHHADDPDSRRLIRESQAEPDLPASEPGMGLLRMTEEVRMPLRLRRAMRDAIDKAKHELPLEWQHVSELIVQTAIFASAVRKQWLPADASAISAALYDLALNQDSDDNIEISTALFGATVRRVRRCKKLLLGTKVIETEQTCEK